MCYNGEGVGCTAHLTRAEEATTHLAACSTLTTSRHRVNVVTPSGSVGRQCVRLRYRQSWAILPRRLPYLIDRPRPSNYDWPQNGDPTKTACKGHKGLRIGCLSDTRRKAMANQDISMMAHLMRRAG